MIHCTGECLTVRSVEMKWYLTLIGVVSGLLTIASTALANRAADLISH